MYCTNCGKELQEGAVCDCAGQPEEAEQQAPKQAEQNARQPYQQPPTQYVVVQQSPAPRNGCAKGGFVCGLLGMILCWIPLVNYILCALGIILSPIGFGLSFQKWRRGAGRGLGIAGIVLSIVGFIASGVVLKFYSLPFWWL